MRKIPTLFERIYENHKVVGITENITEGCEEAFKKGIATVKWDGSCTAIIGGEFYKRYDAKKGRKPPVGAIPCQPEPDPITGHHPYWVKVDANNPADKWFVEAYNNTIVKIDGTYEAIGVHFQGNPYELNCDTLRPHGKDELRVRRDFKSIKEFLAENEIEGIVFWLDGEPKCKIKRSDFGFKWGCKEMNNPCDLCREQLILEWFANLGERTLGEKGCGNCDRDICYRNEVNGIGCDECEVTKGEQDE